LQEINIEDKINKVIFLSFNFIYFSVFLVTANGLVYET
jgi:hypothetical protein